MSIETPSQSEMVELANKVLGDESGLKALVRDVQGKAAVARRDEKAAEAELERVKARIVASKMNTGNWELFEQILKGLVSRWGIEDIEALPSKARTPEDTDVKITPQKVSPETQIRSNNGKMCMYKDQGTKKWCPTRLSGSQKKKGSVYCSKHHGIVYGN